MGNIVWLASYPKSGNTWLRAFLGNYLQDGPRPVQLSELSKFAYDEAQPELYRVHAPDGETAKLEPAAINALRPRVHADLAARVARTAFVKTHNLLGGFEGVPLQNLQVTAGAIYIVRNPLDVVSSVADHFGVSIDDAIEFMGNENTSTPNDELFVSQHLGSWSNHVASWTMDAHPRFLVLRYEDMLANPSKAFMRVARHLNFPSAPARLKKAVRFSSFAQLRALEERTGFVERSPHSQRFFRVGRSGQWRVKLSAAQVNRIVSQHGVQMARFGYTKGMREPGSASVAAGTQ